jgi:hypothetical protein
MVVGGIYFFKDPQKMPEKVKASVDLMKSGADEIGDKTSNFFRDSKMLFEKIKKMPGQINKLLKDSKEEAGK